MDIDYLSSTTLCPPRGAFLSQGAARLNLVALLLWLNHHKWQRWLALTMCTTLTLSALLPRSVLAQPDDKTFLGSRQLIYLLSSLSPEPLSQPLTKSAKALFTGSLLPNAFALSALPNDKVAMQISGWANRVQVKPFFQNDTVQWFNGMYLFSLPHDVAIDSVTQHIAEPHLQGEIFPVEMTYQQLVSYQAEAFSVRFPLANTPRYAGEPAVTSSSPNDNGTYAQMSKTVRWATAQNTKLADKQGVENDYAIVMMMPLQASIGQWPQAASERRLILAISAMLLLLLGAYWLSYASVMQRILLICLRRMRGQRCEHG